MATRRTRPQRARAGAPVPGATLDIGRRTRAAAREITEVRKPRPYSTRYPIPIQEFTRLKNRAATAKVRAKVAGVEDQPKARTRASARGPIAMPAAAPSSGSNFGGIATDWIPADSTMAAGPDHVLVAVNSSLAIFSKSGGPPALTRSLTTWFANVATDITIFDPKVLYDQHEGRWVVLAVAVDNSPRRSFFLLSVSATSNPMGVWNSYALDATVDGTTPTSNWADFPGLGVDNQALYLTANMFGFDSANFEYAKIRVIPKRGPYSGGPVAFFDLTEMNNADGSRAFSLQPCHTFGAPQVQYLVNSSFPGGSSLSLWRIANPVTAPEIVLMTVPVSFYGMPPNAEQKGSPALLLTGDVRIQHAVFRGDSVWTALTTSHDWGGINRASIHWFQIRAAAGSLVQEGIFGASGSHYFFPAGCPDNNGNYILAFSRSGPNEFIGMGYTGRKSNDPMGTLQSSTILKTGSSGYRKLDGNGGNRWGDYNGIAADPENRRIWFCAPFPNGSESWAMWVGSAFF